VPGDLRLCYAENRFEIADAQFATGEEKMDNPQSRRVSERSKKGCHLLHFVNPYIRVDEYSSLDGDTQGVEESCRRL
jgi:hypothetical protein